ncbi:hypothetical protein M408DRAFT_328095 [Serendipita vermifera MAFF 305830]|uniref:Uncharacterized protein n=1 Tax=Serendipita vermifera MAFF 305830 TaxID=933852 RepID=A0A0C3BGC9_SERVB|nr:hypothetical protein M408DRAFT_328095 [Serendipita vermifera MAFF 305830]
MRFHRTSQLITTFLFLFYSIGPILALPVHSVRTISDAEPLHEESGLRPHAKNQDRNPPVASHAAPIESVGYSSRVPNRLPTPALVADGSPAGPSLHRRFLKNLLGGSRKSRLRATGRSRKAAPAPKRAARKSKPASRGVIRNRKSTSRRVAQKSKPASRRVPKSKSASAWGRKANSAARIGNRLFGGRGSRGSGQGRTKAGRKQGPLHKALKGFVKQHGAAIRGAINKAVKWVADTGAKVAKFGLKVVSTVASVASKVVGFIPGVGKAVGKAVGGLGHAANAASNAIKADLGPHLEKGMQVMDKIRNPVGGTAGKVLDAVLKRDVGESLSARGF